MQTISIESAELMIAEEIVSMTDGGDGYMELNIPLGEGVEAYVEADVRTEGHVEDDYFTGTGAHITDFAACRILALVCYDEDGETVEFHPDSYRIERKVEDMLTA